MRVYRFNGNLTNGYGSKWDRINRLIDSHLSNYFNYTKEQLKKIDCLWYIQNDRLIKIRKHILNS